MRHAQLRNEIERIFGVLKRRFRILTFAPEYDLSIQARIPVAMAAMHNFILTHEPLNIPEGPAGDDYPEPRGDFHDPDHRASSEDAIAAEADNQERIGDARREEIANAMWADYVQLRAERGEPVGGNADVEILPVT